MTEDTFVKILKNSIMENGGFQNNTFTDIMRKLLGEKPNFYANIPRGNLSFFSTLAKNNDIPELEEEDLQPMLLDKYWKQPDIGSMTYVVRILPTARKQLPANIYKQIFNGTNLLPAGLDAESKKNPNAKTIWNIVDAAEKSRLTGGQSGSTAFRRKNDAEKRADVKGQIDSLVKSGEIPQNVANTITQNKGVLDAMSKLIVKFLR